MRRSKATTSSPDRRRPFDLPEVRLDSSTPGRRARVRRATAAAEPPPPPDDADPSPPVALHLPVLRQVFLSGEQERQDAVRSTLRPSPGRLRTGAEAVAFFALHGRASSLKFVYCNRAPDDGTFRPYDLVVVSKKRTAPEYFTISASGVVHVSPSQATTFVPLVDWIRDSTNFHVLRSIRFFRHYLAAKAFRLWSGNVRYGLFVGRRARLGAALFLARPSFHLALIEIHKLMYDMQAIRLLNVKTQTYVAKEFVRDQAEQRQRAAKKFEEIVDRLQSGVDAVCTELQERARVTRDGFAHGDSSTALAAALMPAHQQKTLSLVRIKEERARRFRAMRAAQRQADRLGDFVRLVDYMAVENLVALTLTTSAEFLDVLQTPRKSGLFQTTIAYGPEALVFGVTDADIGAIIDRMIDGMIGTVDGVPRLVHLAPFKPLLKGAVDGNVAQLIRASAPFRATCAALADRVRHDFAQTVALSQVFEQWRDVDDFGRTWTVDGFRTTQPPPSVDDIQRLMARLTTWHGDVDRNMRPGFAVGIFHVESRKLKNRLLPILDQAMIAMEALLLESFHVRCEDALRQYTIAIGALDRHPETLSEFAQHLARQKQCRADLGALGHGADQVELMYDLLTSSAHKLVLPSADAVLLDELRAARKQLADRLGAEWERSRARMPEMREQVDQSIARLNLDLSAIEATLSQGPFVDPHADPDAVLAELNQIGTALGAIDDGAATLHRYQAIFDCDPYPFGQLQEVRDKFALRTDLWSLYRSWMAQTTTWLNRPFVQLDLEQMQASVTAHANEIHRLMKRETSPLAALIHALIDEWKAPMPLLISLGNGALQSKHWQAMFAAIGQPYEPIDQLDLNRIRALNLLPHADLIADTVAQAVGEYALQSALAQIATLWDAMDVPVITYRDASDVFVLGDLDPILNHAADTEITLQTMLSSRFVSTFQSDVDDWRRRLSLFNDTLDVWVRVQRAWSHLEAIFSAPDIGKQLPAETKRFADVDRVWRDFMRRVHRKPNALGVVTTAGVHGVLIGADRELQSLQLCLSQYLETKRATFPRLYFLSDNQLLKMISETRQPADIQPHLGAVFDSVRDVRLVHGGAGDNGAAALQAIGITSLDGDYLALDQSIIINGNVEDWLRSIETGLKRTVRDHMRRALDLYPKGGLGWDLGVLKQLVQVAVTVDRIVVTGLMRAALRGPRDALPALLAQTASALERYADLVRGAQRTTSQRLALASLIISNVTMRDLLRRAPDQIAAAWASTALEYGWDGDVHVGLGRDAARFRYGYEYLGAYTPLVPTEATLRCQRALASVAQRHYGAAIVSTTTTGGKTETVKDLARYVGVACLVLRCDPSFGAGVFAQIVAGLAQAGLWACLDAIASVSAPVLSAAGQLVRALRQALIAGHDTIQLDGRRLPLNPSLALFLTLPAVDLVAIPANLRASLRPIALLDVDLGVILRLKLWSEGFADADRLWAPTFAVVRQLSVDLGRRPLSAPVVRALALIAGAYRRAEPHAPESQHVIGAVRKLFRAKVTNDEDRARLEAIVSEQFVTTTSVGDVARPIGNLGLVLPRLLSAEIAARHQISASPALIDLCLRLHESIKFNQAVIVLGAAGVGKSWATSIVAGALGAYAQETMTGARSVVRHVLYPAALSAGQLFGEFGDAHHWVDGIVPRLMRALPPPHVQSWITLDGPIDDRWTQPLSHVLDDNQFLCLPNGERLRIASSIRLVFESDDISGAAPSFVARAALVVVEAGLRTVPMRLEQWAAALRTRVGAGRAARLTSLVQDHVPALVAFATAHGAAVTDLDRVVDTCLTLIEILVAPGRGPDPAALHGEDGAHRVTSMYFLFAVVWSFGAQLEDGAQAAFSAFIRGRFAKGRASGVPLPPESGSVYDYFVSGERAAYLPWAQKIDATDPDPGHGALIMVTPDTIRYRFLLEAFVSIGAHALFTGRVGIGKSTVLNQFLHLAQQRLRPIIVMPMTTVTSADALHAALIRRLDARHRTAIVPPPGKRLVVVVDDLHLPGRSPPQGRTAFEFLRQCLDANGFYDDDGAFKRLIDAVWIGTMTPDDVVGARHRHHRLRRHFHRIPWSDPTEAGTRAVFGAVLSGWVRVANPDLDDCARALIGAMIQIGQRLQMLRPILGDAAAHLLTYHEFAHVCDGIRMIGAGHRFPDRAAFVSLAAHELRRVVADRFPDPIDTAAVDAALNDALRLALPNLTTTTTSSATWMVSIGEPGLYAPIGDRDALRARLEAHVRPPLVLYDDAVQHVCRLGRVLRQAGAHAVLVGPDGSGRRTLTQLTASLYQMTCVVTSSSSSSSWSADLIRILTVTGAEQRPLVWCVTDAALDSDAVVGAVQAVVDGAGGDLDHWFGADEFEALMGRRGADRDEARRQFHDAVRAHVHVVVTLRPSPSRLERCRRLLPILGRFHQDWFRAWSEPQLMTIGARFIVDDALRRACVQIHSSTTSSSTSSYLDLVQLVPILYQERRDRIDQDRDRYGAALVKLQDASDGVDGLRETVQRLSDDLQTASDKAGALMAVLEREQDEARRAVEACARDEADCDDLRRRVDVIGAECDADLSDLSSALDTATSSLDVIQADDVAVLRAFTTPPKIVELIVSGVCLVLGEAPTWSASRRLLGPEIDLVAVLRQFDRRTIPSKTLKKLQAIVTNVDFDPDRTRAVSRTITALCEWVGALYRYAIAWDLAEPRRRALTQADTSWRQARDVLDARRQYVAEVEGRVRALHDQYAQSVADQAAARVQADLVQRRLERAQSLLGQCAEHGRRWRAHLDDLQLEMANGDLIVGAAASIAYLGPFPASIRCQMRATWIAICDRLGLRSSSSSLRRLCGDHDTIRAWVQQHGLPDDDDMIDSALIVMRSRRWPWLIDPDQIAERWLRSVLAPHLIVCRAADGDCVDRIEEAIRTGSPILIDGAGLDSGLESLLRQQFDSDDGRTFVRVGDRPIPLGSGFRLYLSTRSTDDVDVALFRHLTPITFATTSSILDRILIDVVVDDERPDLQRAYRNLLGQVSDAQTRRDQLDRLLLQRLASCPGSILDDMALVDELGADAEACAATQTAVTQSEASLAEIDQQRRLLYDPIVKRASMLFFTANAMSQIRALYHWSVTGFVAEFRHCLHETAAAADDDRLRDLTRSLMRSLASALPDPDRFVFGFVTALGSSMAESEVALLLRGAPIARASYLPAGVPDRARAWIDQDAWTSLVNLSAVSPFVGLGQEMIADPDWEPYLAQAAPMPMAWASRLTPFQRLIVTKIVHGRSHLYAAMGDVIGTAFGPDWTSLLVVDGAERIRRSRTPILLLPSDTGTDPCAALRRLAPAQQQLLVVAIGDGQAAVVLETVTRGRASGHWILIDNCHLNGAVPFLIDVIDSCPITDSDDNGFRLFLSAAAGADVAVDLRRRCAVLSLDAPADLRAQLLDRYARLAANDLGDARRPPVVFQRVVFAVACLDAVLERRTRYAGAWRSSVEWMESDFELAVAHVRSVLSDEDGDDSDRVPWERLRDGLAQVVYGGRMTDSDDLQLVCDYVRDFISESLVAPEVNVSGVIPAPPLVDSIDAVRDFIRHLAPVDLSKEVLRLQDDPESVVGGRRASAVLSFLEQRYKGVVGSDHDRPSQEASCNPSTD